MPGIGIITNPHSRRNKRYPERMRRLGYMLGRHDTYELTNRIEDIEEVAREFKANDIDILALNGGDGTNHVTLSHFIEVYGDQPLPKIALLRGGTMNTVSNALGIRGKPATLLANLVEKYYTDRPFETSMRDILKVTDDERSRYGFIFGNGLVANFLELYYDTGDPSPTTAALLLTRALATLPVGGGDLIETIIKPFRASIEMPQETWAERDYTAVIASTVDQIGLGFRPFTRCQEREGTFHLMGVTSGAFGVATSFPRIRLGLPLSEEKFPNQVADRAVFRSSEPIGYTIDGDMHVAESGKVTLECGPRLEIIIK